LLVTAVPFFSERPGSCPKTYHPAGIERGTATIKSTRPGTTSAPTR
jgi:hypothetical protein